MADFWSGMARAYQPLGALLQRGTQAAFGPQATFFPKSWGVSTDYSSPEGVPPSQPGYSPSFIPDIPDYADIAQPQGPGLTAPFDLSRVRDDLEKAAQGDPGARARVATMRDSPGVADLGKVKPSPIEGLMEGGIAQLPPEMMQTRQAGPQESQPLHPNAGGEGVSVQDPETGGKKRDWASAIPALTVGLSDIFNSFGRPQNAIRGGGYELAKQQLQSQQMEALERRHAAFDDAYNTVKNLPADVFSDPRFADLAKAANDIRASADKGQVDNQKAISNLVTQAALHKRELDQLGLQSKISDQLQLEQGLQTGRDAMQTQRLTQLQKIVDEGGPGADAAQLEIAKLAPYNFEGVTTDQATYLKLKEARDLKESTLQVQMMIHGDNNAARIQAAQISAAARQDAQQNQAMGRIGSGLNMTLNNTLRGLIKTDPTTGEPVNAAQAVIQMYAAHTDDIIAAGQAAGMRVFKAGIGNDGKPIISVDGRPMDGMTALAFIRAKIGMPSGAAMSYSGPGSAY